MLLPNFISFRAINQIIDMIQKPVTIIIKKAPEHSSCIFCWFMQEVFDASLDTICSSPGNYCAATDAKCRRPIPSGCPPMQLVKQNRKIC